MHAVSGVVVFILIWWCTLFCVLPLGQATQYEGQDTRNVNMKQKLLLTTVISVILWCVVALFIAYDVIRLEEMLKS